MQKSILEYLEHTVKVFPEITAFLGVIYAGCHYIPIDEEMPKQRIELILKSLKSVTVLCDKETFPISEEYGFSGNIYMKI